MCIAAQNSCAQTSDLDSWDWVLSKMSSHAQIWPQGAEKHLFVCSLCFPTYPQPCPQCPHPRLNIIFIDLHLNLVCFSFSPRLPFGVNFYKQLSSRFLLGIRRKNWLQIMKFWCRNNSQIICDKNVVRFFSLVTNNILTVEGWMDGNGYFCEDDKDNKHEIKTYREYFHFHDLESVFKSHSLFSQVKREQKKSK